MEGRIYTPGAGHRPPVLAGRDDIIRDWLLTCNDVQIEGRVAADDLVFTGPRGVGKTALVDVLADRAREVGYEVIALQAVQGRPQLIDSLVETAAYKISEEQPAWVKAKKAFSRLASVNVSVLGHGGGISTHAPPEQPRSATDPRAVASALAALSEAVYDEAGRGGVLVTVDEMQVGGPDLPMLAAALHRLNSQHPTARVLFAGTGLPNTQHVMERAGVTHPGRLFNMVGLPTRLDASEARYALTAPATQHGVAWEPRAQDLVLEVTGGYPAHLQAFAHRVWRAAEGLTITEAAAREGIAVAADEFKRRTMDPLWAALGPRQREYLTAVAVAGGEAESGIVSRMLGRTTAQDAVTRAALIDAGHLYSRALNHIALSTPLAGAYAQAHYVPSDDTDMATVDQMQARLYALQDSASHGVSGSRSSAARHESLLPSNQPADSPPSDPGGGDR